MTTYDVIVLGTGGIGSAAALCLARQGLRVLGLDRYAGPHQFGSSHGHARAIRQAYSEHPDYVPLVQRSLQLWRELEQASQQQLYHEVGLLLVGPGNGAVVPGARLSAQTHGLPLDTIDAETARGRFPGFHVPDGFDAAFEQRAGYLLVEDCVAAHLAEATKAGVDFKTCEVRSWNSQPQCVVVETDQATYSSDRLVVAAGAWAGGLLRNIGATFKILRQPQNWFPNRDQCYLAEQGCPVYLFEVPEGVFYGFPQLDERGVKIGRHDAGVEISDPSSLDRSIDQLQRSEASNFVSKYLPGNLWSRWRTQRLHVHDVTRRTFCGGSAPR